MGEVELSCGLPPGPDFADLAVLAEELGYARIWAYDSAPLWEDTFVHLALAAIGPWRVVDWHNAYAQGGAQAVDAMPGGQVWREELEALAPAGERHLLTFEGHVTDMGFQEIIYTPTGPDVRRELRAFASVRA